MKKLFVSYSNCQGGGVLHFLKKTPLAEVFDFVQINNWQIIMLEQSKEWAREQLKKADVLIFQPTGEMHCRDGFTFPSSAQLIHELVAPSGCPTASFSYQFNHGFFPIVKGGPGFDGWWTGDLQKFIARRGGSKREVDLSVNQALSIHSDWNYDCARRFVECLAEQSRREEEDAVSVKMVPWILANYRKHRLFLCQNHLTTRYLIELATRLLDAIWDEFPNGYEKAEGTYDALDQMERTLGEDDVNVGGTLKVHPAVVRELGLNYPADSDQSQYLKWLEEMIRQPDL